MLLPFKISFYFVYVFVFVCMQCQGVGGRGSAHRSLKRIWHTLELELRAVVSVLMGVLGIKVEASERIIRTFNY